MSSVIELQPLTRVEGHGRITVYLTGKRVERVRLTLYESPRLFETLLRGKRLEEIPEIICRICSLCSTVHRVTALLALEKALGIAVSRQAQLYRELIVNGGHIQSHALHLFCLTLPDIVGVDGFPALGRTAPELMSRGLRIKAVGNLIQETVGGRLIHPVTLITGGMGKPVDRHGLVRIGRALEEVLPDAVATVDLFASAASTQPPLPSASYLAVAEDGSPPFFGSGLRLGEEETIPAEEYSSLLGERSQRGTNAKWSHTGGRRVVTGAISRLNLGLPLSPGGRELRKRYAEHIDRRDMRGNNVAQAIELVHAIERCQSLVDELLAAGFPREPLPTVTPREGCGCAVMEAPRGVLIHRYALDREGRCINADVVTPTAINQAAMEGDLLALARWYEGADEQELRQALEVHVRAYDPCISCAVHLVQI